MDTERVEDGEGGWQTRTTLPPLPMKRKSTNAPMPDREEGLLPTAAMLRVAEERAQAKRRAQGQDPWRAGGCPPQRHS